MKRKRMWRRVFIHTRVYVPVFPSGKLSKILEIVGEASPNLVLKNSRNKWNKSSNNYLIWRNSRSNSILGKTGNISSFLIGFHAIVELAALLKPELYFYFRYSDIYYFMLLLVLYAFDYLFFTVPYTKASTLKHILDYVSYFEGNT